MEITQLVFTILIWLWLVGIAGALFDIKKLAVTYVEAKLEEMRMFHGRDTDK